MSESLTTVLLHALAQPEAALPYALRHGLEGLYPGQYVLESTESAFDANPFAAAGHAAMQDAPGVPEGRLHHWDAREEPRVAWYPENVAVEVQWNGETLRLVTITRSVRYGSKEVRRFLVARTEGIAAAFFDAVCAFTHPPREQVLVFKNGCVSRSRDMFEAARKTRMEDLFLPGTLRDQIVEDLSMFLGSKEHYNRYGLAWKRGLLFVGPPGNGKTHCVKAAIGLLGMSCLYVQSLTSRYGEETDNIDAVFATARAHSPCLLVLEDLDSLINDKNRSAFLNQLDGLNDNDGTLTIATTNYVERLDASIADRPSRFDRKYHFPLPDEAERRRYLSHWNDRTPELKLEADRLEHLVRATESFSYAYLRELFVSATIQWATRRGAEKTLSMSRLLEDNAELLQLQRVTEQSGPPPRR